MKRNMIVTIAALALLAVGGTAIAQQAGPRGGQGGPGQFGPGGQRGPMMGMRMGLNGPELLRHPNVQKDLGLTDEQKNKIDELLPRRPQGPGGPPRQGGFGGGQGGPPPEGGFGGGPGGPPEGGFGGGQRGQRGPGGQQGGQDMERKIAEILTSTQLRRYHEIQLQASAPMSLLRPDISEKLGLSENQRDKIDGIIRDGMPMPPRGPGGGGFGGGQGGPPPEGGPGGPPEGGFGGPPPGGPGGPPPGSFGGGSQRGPGGPGMMGDPAKRQETLKKALAVLTSDQRSKWQSMTGKAIDLTPPKRNED